MEIFAEENTLVYLGNTTFTNIVVTILMAGGTYSFRVASVDAADRMSNWSQSVSLVMQGLLLLHVQPQDCN